MTSYTVCRECYTVIDSDEEHLCSEPMIKTEVYRNHCYRCKKTKNYVFLGTLCPNCRYEDGEDFR